MGRDREIERDRDGWTREEREKDGWAGIRVEGSEGGRRGEGGERLKEKLLMFEEMTFQ